MENTTPFELNRAIQGWRENLSQSPAVRDGLDELEGHLRDSIAKLELQGLTADEAFVVAVKRMGNQHTLAAEFAKIDQCPIWIDRVLWMLIGIQCWGLVHGVIGGLASNAVSFGLNGYDFSLHGRGLPITLFGVASLLGFATSLAGCWWLFSRHGSGLGKWVVSFMRRRSIWYTVVVASLSLLLVAFSMNYGMILLRLKFTDVQKLVNITQSQQYIWMAGSVIQTVTFVILTVLLIRKRLSVVRA